MRTSEGRRAAPGRSGRLPGARTAVRSVTGLLLVGALAACDGGPPAESGTAGAAEAPENAPAASRSPSGQVQDPASDAPQDTQRVNISDMGVNTGIPDAPIQVVEFSDFGCPHCRDFHMNAYPELYRDYVETGQVIWKYIPVAMGMFPNSLEATRAGQCAIEQSDFAPMRDALFRNQLDWVTSDDPTGLFVGYAEEVGLEVERFRSCLQERRGEEEIREAVRVAEQIRIEGTPTFFIQGQRVEGARPTQFFRQVFDQMLEQTDAQGGPSGGP